MEITEAEFAAAQERMARQREAGHALSARYDRRRQRLIVRLHHGVEVAFAVDRIEGLAQAAPEDRAVIEISPSGLGLHFPRLDADVYLPALLQGVFGSRRWMAQLMGAAGGSARSAAKAEAARRNGRLGGRPRRDAA